VSLRRRRCIPKPRVASEASAPWENSIRERRTLKGFPTQLIRGLREIRGSTSIGCGSAARSRSPNCQRAAQRLSPRAKLYHRGAQTPQQLLKTSLHATSVRVLSRWWTITSNAAPPRSRLAEKNEQKLRNLKSGVSFPKERFTPSLQVVMRLAHVAKFNTAQSVFRPSQPISSLGNWTYPRFRSRAHG